MKIEEPKTLEGTDNKEVKPDIPVEDKKEEVKEETKTLFEKIWEFILKIFLHSFIANPHNSRSIIINFHDIEHDTVMKYHF